MEGDSASVIPRIIRENLILFLSGSIGLILLVVGFIVTLGNHDDGVVIEKSPSTKVPASEVSPHDVGKIVVDVEGAVLMPGIYTLPVDSREKDAIQVAGGLVQEADTGAIAKGMNMAAKLSDGMKIYLPFKGESSIGVVQGGGAEVKGASSGSVSINSASESQLDSLPGVGPATAAKIINNRPYSSLDDLVSKKAVTNNVFQKIKELIVL